MEDDGVTHWGFPIQRVESAPVQLSTHDLAQAGQQVKVLFVAVAVAGLLVALGIEILNLVVYPLGTVLGRSAARNGRRQCPGKWRHWRSNRRGPKYTQSTLWD